MPKCLKYYKDKEKARAYRNRNRKKNYQQTQLYERREWTDEEVEMVLEHKMPDRQLSAIIERSVTSIQLKRTREKKARRIAVVTE